jgi:hypothetical protein
VPALAAALTGPVGSGHHSRIMRAVRPITQACSSADSTDRARGRALLKAYRICDHAERMGDVHPFPHRGSVFVDARGEQRTMRVACHPDEGIVVISLWAAGMCRASFRLPAALAPEMAELLAACGGDAAPDPRIAELMELSPPAEAS